MKGLTFYTCVITEGVVSVAGEGGETPAPAVAVRAVQCRSDRGTQAWMALCDSCTAKSCSSAVVCWKAPTKGCSTRVTVQGAVTPSLLYSQNCRR